MGEFFIKGTISEVEVLKVTNARMYSLSRNSSELVVSMRRMALTQIRQNFLKTS